MNLLNLDSEYIMKILQDVDTADDVVVAMKMQQKDMEKLHLLCLKRQEIDLRRV